MLSNELLSELSDLWWCGCGGMVVVVWLWWCGCGGVVVVVWLWWCGCGGGGGGGEE